MTLIQILSIALLIIIIIAGLLFIRSRSQVVNIATPSPSASTSATPLTSLTPSPSIYPSTSTYPSSSAYPTSTTYGNYQPSGEVYSSKMGVKSLPATGVSTPGNVVTIGSTGFSPKEIVIKPGETVIWINADDVLHGVVSASSIVSDNYSILDEIGEISPSSKKEHTFTQTGMFKYRDIFNPHMTGLVTVRD